MMSFFSIANAAFIPLVVFWLALVPCSAQKANAPDIVMFASNAPVCEGGNLAFSVLAMGDGPMTYKWYKNGSEIFTGSSTLNFNPCALSDSGVYKVKAINPYGIDSSFSITVHINPLPVAELGNDTTICVDASVTLDAGANCDAYSWSDGSWGQTLQVNNTTAGTYTYIVSVMLDGCYNADTIIITETACTGISVYECETITVRCTGNRYLDIEGAFGLWQYGIFDLEGKCIGSGGAAVKDPSRIFLPQLTPGYYLVYFYNESTRKRLLIYIY